MSSNRKNELRKELIELYKQGDHYDGSLVYRYESASADQDGAVRTLGEQYSNDMQLFSLGFNYGYSSFLDCLIGKNQCYVESQKEEGFRTQKCVFILFCHYKNIYVLGEYTYLEKGGFILPSFQAVDNFTANRTSSLANNIGKLLENCACQRVFASELDGSIPDSIKIESNLVGEYPLVFDGYFNWID